MTEKRQNDNRQQKVNILIVDDRPENLHAMDITLSPLNDVKIFTAQSGNDALSLMLENDFAVVLMDVQMPEMDGFETANLMQNHPATKQIPIIFVTAISKDEEHVFEGYKAGAVDYLFKPLNHDILISKVTVFLNLYKQRIEVEKMQKQIQNVRNLESLGMLAGGIAHDFNNLMTTVFANVELAQLKSHQGGEVYSKLAETLKGVDQAQYLTQQLLTFSKGGMLIKENTDVIKLLNKSCAIFLDNAKINVHIEVKTENTTLDIDQNQIKQVFENLIMNAKEAMVNGGNLSIQIEDVDTNQNNHPTWIQKDGFIKIALNDDGPGMDEEVLNRIFDPYFSTKEKGIKKGQGLGLSIAFSIVKKHGGNITAESEPGNGTSISIFLPKNEPNEGNTKLLFDDEKTVSTVSCKKCLLILENQMKVAEVLVEMLKCIGYEAQIAANEQEAVALYAGALKTASPFDGVILGDGEVGLNALKRLQNLHSQIVVIISSGYVREPELSNYKNLGASEVIRKPFTLDTLTQVLSRVF